MLLLVALVSMACSLTNPRPTPTATQSVTQAFQTVQARLTEAIAMTPSATITPVPTEPGIETPTPTPSSSPTTAPQSTATSICDRAAAGNPIDVTIPDDTLVKPGETFTKIWSLSNAGTCSWTIQYEAVWFSGEMMGAPSSVALTDNVLPGETVEISVDMVAPLAPGTFQSNWKLRNPAGQLFGIGPGGNSPFWVRIEVPQLPTATPGPSPEPTAVEDPTATPAVLASGSATMNAGDSLDLDSNLGNPSGGADINYEADSQGMLFLNPLPGVTMGFWGPVTPSFQECQATNLSSGSLPVDSLAPGAHLCYQTDQGHFGWLRLINRTPDNVLMLEILTWATL